MNSFWAALFLVYFSIARIQGQSELELDDGDVRFFLHSRELGETELVGGNNLEIIDVTRPTKVLIHGYGSDHTHNWVRLSTDAFLRKGDYNVVLIDWSPIASLDFTVAAAYIPVIGEYTGTVISLILNDIPLRLEDIHIVGHSMGAQIAGFIGKTVFALTESKVARITGLDPAQWIAEEDGRLAAIDAELVDIVHTTFGDDVLPFTMGHIDFYPNGGLRPQPGCTALTEVSEACSHYRSTYLFAEELENSRGFVGTKCDTLDHFIDGACATEHKISMGADLTIEDAGNYYFITNDNYPFSTESTTDD